MSIFDPGFYGKMPLPKDTTLGICRDYMIAQFYSEGMCGDPQQRAEDWLRVIKKEHGVKWETLGIEIHHYYAHIEGMPRRECPDSMTLGEFQKLEPPGEIAISFKDGGLEVKPKVPELV